MQDVCRLVGERLHLLPPFRWRLATVPLGLDLPYWVEDPDFDLDFHIRESAVPPPGDDRSSRRPWRGCSPGRWTAAAAVGALRHPGPADGRVALLTKIHHAASTASRATRSWRAARPRPEGGISAGPERRAAGPGDRDARPRPAGSRASRCARCARSRRRRPHRPARRQRAARSRRRTVGCGGVARRERGVLEVTKARPPRRRSTARLGAPALRVRLALARRVRHRASSAHGQRRRRHAVRRRGARVAAGRATRCPRTRWWRWSRCRCARRDEKRRLGQPDLDDDRADPDQRARPGDAGCSARTSCLRSAKERHSALPAEPADRRDGVHPARGRRARGAQHGRHPQPHAPAAEPRDLQRPRPARPALLRGRRAGGELPGVA